MDFFEAVAKRGSYRNSFTEKKLTRDELRKIVQAGIQAPSGCNAQTTSFVIVDDPATLKQIADILGKSFCATAAALIVCVVDKRAVFGDMAFYREDCAASANSGFAFGDQPTRLDCASLQLDRNGLRLRCWRLIPRNDR